MECPSETTPHGTGAESVGPLDVTVHLSLAQAEPAWRRLQETGVCYGFQTFEWLSAWQALQGEPAGVRPVIVEVCAGPAQTPVMVMPLCLHSKHGLSILSFLGGWLTDYHAPLLSPDFARNVTPQQFSELWAQVRKVLPQADYIHFWRMPENVEGLPNPFIRLAGAWADEQSHFTMLPASYEAYETSRGDSFRRKSRRRRRRLAELGPLEFSVAETPQDIATVMDALVRQKARRHLETAGFDPYAADPRRRQFYETLALLGADGPRGLLHSLTVGGTLVATEWGFLHGGRYLDILPGYEAADWGRYSPGLVMKAELMQWCIERGLKVFDLTVGEEAFKDKWTECVMPVFVLHRPLSLRGAAYWAAVHLRLGLKKLLGPLRQALARRRQRQNPTPKET